jgi:hypothetical protein
MNHRISAGIGLLAVTALGLAVWQGRERPLPAIEITGRGCGTKAGLLANPVARAIWTDRHGIGRIDCEIGGSIEICQDRALLAGRDFVWPASLYAIDLCQKTLGRSLDYALTFHSPVVIYSWDCVVRELTSMGLVEQIGGVHYITDMPRLARLIVDGASWGERCGLYGPMRVIPTDPTTSTSGVEFAVLLASMLLDGRALDDDSVGRVLPRLRAYIHGLGHLESTSARLFASCVRTGMGECPMFALYESQGIDFIKQHPADHAHVTGRVRILYPRPTVWAAHQMIALSPKGKALMESLRDKDLLEVAWKSHGFRTGSIGNANDPRALGIPGIPEFLDAVIPMPRRSVMERITAELARP